MVIVAWRAEPSGAVAEQDADGVHAGGPVDQVEVAVFVEVALSAAKLQVEMLRQ